MNDRFKQNMLAVALWALWYARNRVIYEGVVQSSSELAGFVLGYMAKLETVLRDCVSVSSNLISKWFLPSHDIVKANFDSAFNIQTKSACYGVIIRNNI